MDKNINRIVKTYIHSVLNHQTDLVTAYIFGSYARNKQKSESDIDVALVIDNLADKDRFDTQVKLMMLAAEIDSRIEPHPISKEEMLSKNPFVLEIIESGIKVSFR